MNKGADDLLLFLFTCSGEDNFILKNCSKRIQKRFALIGAFVLIIFTGCFFSATFFTYSLFDGAKWASIPIGIMWGTVVSNIYLLLLHTISPEIIPLSSKKKKQSNKAVNNYNFLTFSMLLRLGFMILLAIIIAQPLNVFMLSKTVEDNIEKHKIVERIKLFTLTNKELIEQELYNLSAFNSNNQLKANSDLAVFTQAQITFINHKITEDQNFMKKSNKLLTRFETLDQNFVTTEKEEQEKKNILAKLEKLLNTELASDSDFLSEFHFNSKNEIVQSDYFEYQNNLIELINKKTENYNQLNVLLNKSNFYVKTIQLLLHENPVAWCITFLVSMVFLLPIYFKYSARNLSTKLFHENRNKNQDIIALREELINTKNFNWLANKINKIDLKKIHTSDYYFQRMLIEHKIILEEYASTKNQYSNLLTENILKYNKNSLARINPLLEKLKKVNITKYNELKNRINQEYKDEVIVKYEYWLDSPFRTKKIHRAVVNNDEIGLLDFIYNQPRIDENL